MTVTGDSMAPTFQQDDVVLVHKFLRFSPALHHGDLVVFRDDDDVLSLKRVIGLPGEEVAIRDAMLLVDGEPRRESFVDYPTIDGLYFGPVTVPAGRVLVMGDNRARSIDSRNYGAVPIDQLMGSVALRLWPLRRG